METTRTYFGYGKYEIIKTIWLSLANLMNGVHLVASVFLSASVDFRCKIPGLSNDTYAIQDSQHNATVLEFVNLDAKGKYEECTLNINGSETQCNSWVYDQSQFISTTTTAFNVVCDQTSITTVAGVIYMAGLLFGSLIFGTMSDVFGRKITLFITMVLQGALALATMFSPNMWTFITFRLLLGGCSVGSILAAFILLLEIAPKHRRPLAAIFQTFGWCSGIMLLSLLAYFIRSWNYLQLSFALLSVPFILSYWWLIDESPVWLVSKGKLEQAQVVINKLNKVNGTEKTIEDFREDSSQDSSQDLNEPISVLFKSPILLLNTALNCFMWFVASMGYYGLALNVGNLVGDLYINNFVGGLVEIPAYLALVFTIKLGRKYPFVGLQLTGGVALIISAFLIVYKSGAGLDWVIVTVSMIGKFAVSSAFELMFYWSAEMYPTSLRNRLTGSNSMWARVGGMIAPVIADIPKYNKSMFAYGIGPLVFGGFMVLSGILGIILPETMGVPLPNTASQASQLTWRHKLKGKTYDDISASDGEKYNGTSHMKLQEL